jgi:hypothetical protein
MEIRMVNPDTNAQELYWGNYSSKSFYEQFGLNAEELKLFEDTAE